MQILPNAKSQFIDQNGLPLASGSVGFYSPGTLNPKATFQDAAGTIANTNPVLLDSRGQALIWGTGVYRQIVKDASGVTIWDQITEDPNSALTGNITDSLFVAGTDFTPGVTTQLTLTANPGSVANMWIFFDGVYQADDQIASLNVAVLTFNSPIPVGVSEVTVKIGTTVALGTPGTGTVVDASVASNAAINSSKLAFRQQGSGAVVRTVQNKLYDRISVKDYGAKGDGTTDDTAAFNLAITFAGTIGGANIFVPAGEYLISSTLVVSSPNITLEGDSAYSATLVVPSNVPGFNGFNPNAVIVLNANNCAVRNLGMDGNIANNTSQSFGAISNTLPVTGIYVEDCYIRNFIYNGIVLNPATTSTSNYRINRNRLENIGWGGIIAFCSVNGEINGNSIVSCGSDGIMTGYNSNISNFTIAQYVVIDGNYVNRAVPPTFIVGNAAEAGFMIVVGAGDQYVTVSNNICYDNRNAAQDGIGLGQDGSRSNEGLVFDGNVVIYAGLYGIDVSSNHVVSNNYVRYSAQQGIKLGTDAGGNLVNATVDSNIIDSCNFAGTGSSQGIWIAATLTGSFPTALYENIKITNNRVVDFNPTPHTIYGLGIDFQNNLTYLNNEFNFNDWSQLAGVNGNAFVVGGMGSNYVGWAYKGNKHPAPVPAISGATPLIMGLDIATIVNGGATSVLNFLGGFDGQELTIQSGNGNTTYNNGSGIVIHSAANQVAAASSIYKFFHYTNWYLNQFFTP